MTKPRLVVFAGPNGSGKSTLYRKLKGTGKIPELYINADDIARDEFGHIPNYKQRNLEAAKLAEQRRKDALRTGKSFAFETVMSTPGKLAILQEALVNDFLVELVFVATQSADINIGRVANRAALGGHDVEPSAVRRRFARALELLPSAVALVDEVVVFDNSGLQMKCVATKQGTKFSLPYLAESPDWILEKIVAPLLTRESAGSAIREACQKHSGVQVCSICAANTAHGQIHKGEVVALNDFFVAQHAGGMSYLVHDRVLCPPMDFRLGKDTSISYHYINGGKLQ